jgi:putative ABC transport system ATP-binding protein
VAGRFLLAQAIVVQRGDRRVLDGATLRVDAGSVVVIEGASGSGKSTLLRVMATLLEPDSGEVILDDISASALSPQEFRRRVAFVAQRPPMLAGDVEANVGAGPRLRGEPLGRARILELLREVSLEPASIERPADELSGGEQQRVAIARALANDPEFLLLDEPTSALDPATASRVVDTIRALARRGLGVVVVTHDRAQASALTVSPWRCADGRLVAARGDER